MVSGIMAYLMCRAARLRQIESCLSESAIIRKAVQTPLRRRRERRRRRCGHCRQGAGPGRVQPGFDAQTGAFKDLVKAGIIDPTKVVRTALQDAASAAGLLVTTEAMIAERPEKKGAAGGAPGGGMGGMGGMGDMDF